MAKKRRRRRKHGNSRTRIYRGRNRHHLIWTRKDWSRGEWSSRLRSHEVLIMMMDANKHRMIHERMDGVPVANETACKRAYIEIERLYRFGAINERTSLETRLKALICIFEYIAQPTADALKQELRIVQEIRGG